ncbi:unnamed protein product [Arctia plantaginis]|uniref:SAYSvFN domain-containing protein n=1 Tax=Arctia plantaginis TaxID=874455 RepID=A0A8S1AV55_ARCPL|nr:unnamed protein product [Arctia plantaginis]
MEAKLKKFRSLRSRKESKDNNNDKIDKSKRKITNSLLPRIFRNMGIQEEEVLLIENDEPLPAKPNRIKEKLNEVIPQVSKYTPELTEVTSEVSDVISEVSEPETLEEENPVSWQYCIIKYSAYAIIWLSLFIYFIKLQFGAVYFGVTVLIGICLNTRTKPKKRGEVSAYSVFNEDCASIDGTLKAEELQRQLLYGSLPVRIF